MPPSVDPAVYDKQYFQIRYQNIDYQKLKSLSEFDHIYRRAGALVELKREDKVIDFGCGAGHLAFYLYLKYGCDITGLDYSPDALFLCAQNLNILKRRSEYAGIGEKIRFGISNLNNLPDFKEIKAVFLLDVVEHLYDGEIDSVLRKIKDWSGKNGIQIVIHTDNNNYLRFVRPAMDWLSICFGKLTLAQLQKNKAIEARGHINLTTAGKLKKKLAKNGFKILKLAYPEMDREIVKAQLGEISNIKPLFYAVYYLGKMFYFLRPSFYIVAIG